MSTRPDDCGAGSLMLSVDQAKATMLEGVTPITTTQCVTLHQALGRVLAKDIQAKVNVPGHTNSAMDGFAVRAADLDEGGVILEVIGDSFAGHPFSGQVKSGQSVRIMTGGALPDGADSIIMQEHASVNGQQVHISEVVTAGHHVRKAGEDLAAGETILRAGQHLTAADLGLIASVGIDQIAVYRAPRVAFFTTGDELLSLNQAPKPGHIYDSNRFSLYALLAEMGIQAHDLGQIKDDRKALKAALEHAKDFDAVITSGGASVGAADFIVELLQKLGRVNFWSVAIKPGRPVAFGHLEKTLFFGMPGNPVSTMASFINLVRPALVRLAGGRPAQPIQMHLPITRAIRRRPGRQEYQRGKIQQTPNGYVVKPCDHQGSGVLRSMSQADCFIVLAPDCERVEAQEIVTVEPFAQKIWD